MMCTDDGSQLIGILEGALTNPAHRDRLLQQPELLQQIMNSIDARSWLFRQACQETDLNRKRKSRQMIIQMMQASGGIWRGGNGVNLDDYAEASSRAWLWFGEKLDEYDPSKASFVTWFNKWLRWRIVDVTQERINRQFKEIQVSQRGDEEHPQSIERMEASPPDESLSMLEEIRGLVQRDPGRQLQNKRMQQYPHVNAQKLLLSILTSVEAASEIQWQPLATQLGVPESSLRSFYQTGVKPLFKKIYDDEQNV